MPAPVPLPPPPLTVRRPPWGRRVRIVLWRTRIPLTALCVGLAAVAALDELRPPPAVTVDVLVAARDLPAGTTLAAPDVRIAHLPPEEALADARTRGSAGVVGRRTAVPVPAGLPLVPGVLAGGRLTGPPGTVVTAVRLADAAVVRLLSPGDRVDVLAASTAGGPGATIATGALVLPSPVASGDSGGLLGAGSSSSDPVPLMLAVRPDEAAALAGAAGTADLSAVVVP